MNLIGSRLGQYEIIEEIGKGGMATVYRAYQPTVGRFVAVKVIHRAIAADSVASERFQREARLVARLEHPHLLPIYDFDGEHDPPYIVMRLLEGGTLKDALENGPIPPADAAHMLRQVGSALDYAHRQGVIHRDIKPSNVMIDTEGNAFLTDFGIARSSEVGEGLTQSGFAVGTPSYMSPEQGMGLPTVSSRSDIYSLGVLLYQLLTGELPFTGDTPLAVIMQHIQTPPPDASARNRALPGDVDQLLRRAMAKEPDERYQTAAELALDFTRVMAVGADAPPLAIKRAAQAAFQEVLDARQARKTQIEATMTLFESQRAASTPRASRTFTLEGETVITDSQPPIAV